MNPTLARRAATFVVGAIGALGLAGCVTTLPGTAGHAPASAVSASTDGGTNGETDAELKKQCSAALASAKGFLGSWKELATGDTPPNADQRDELADEVQGYIDELQAQMLSITDEGLLSHLQEIISEMNSIVLGLQTGVAVELSAYSASVNATTEYCK